MLGLQSVQKKRSESNTSNGKSMKINSTISILSYNLGLLKVQPFGDDGFTLYENPPYVKERFPHMSKQILTSNADILVLQEVWKESHAKVLVEQLSPSYPHICRRSQSYPWQLHNGLMVLSKFPISNVKLVPHAKSEWTETAFAPRCMLIVEISIPHIGLLCIINMHATAGRFDPESFDEIRETELKEAIEECEKFSSKSKDRHQGRAVIVGDLNMGPEQSKPNYDYMIQNGFVDGVLQAMGMNTKMNANAATEVVNPSKILYTWDPTNILNNEGIHNHCPKCRLDHLFLEKDSKFCAKKAKVFMEDPFIPVIHKGKETDITLSDHYGLLMDLSLSTQ